jgi:valyl-tRNA synthetase
MPFITEELWAETGKSGPARESLLILTEWPDLAGHEDPAADAELSWLIDVISNVRSVRAEMNVPGQRQAAAGGGWCRGGDAWSPRRRHRR